MNTFFYTEGHVFETEESAKSWLGQIKGKIETIDTDHDFDTFEANFSLAKKQGNDDLTALEDAR